MRKSIKKITSLVLVVMLVISCAYVAAFSVSAAPSGTKVYFKNTDNWSTVNCYAWKGSTNNSWPGKAMTDEGNGIFSFTSDKEYDNLIFNNGSTQTDSLDFPTNEYNYFNYSTKNWENANGEAKGDTGFESVALVGMVNGGSYNWDDDTLYPLTLNEKGEWSTTITFTGGANEFKARVNGKWTTSFGGKGSYGNFTDTLTGTYVISVPDGAANGTLLTVTEVASTDPTEPTTVPSTEPTTVPSTEPTTEPSTEPTTEPAEVDYYLCGYINGKDYGNDDFGNYKFVNNEVTVELTQESYVMVKSTNNIKYMTKGWLGKEVTEAKLYNENNITNKDKLYVPAGTVKFTLVVNSDDTLTLSYAVVPTYTVTVSNGEGEATTATYTEKSACELTAANVEGKKFSHWAVDGKAVSYSASYGFYVTKDVTITAVYATDEVQQKPVINISNVYKKTANGKNYVTFQASRDVPKGYTVVEHGIIYGLSASTFGNGKADTALVLNGNKVKKYTPASKGNRGLYTLSVSVGSNLDGVVYARGYMVVKDSAGNTETIYSDVESASYNSAKAK